MKYKKTMTTYARIAFLPKSRSQGIWESHGAYIIQLKKLDGTGNSLNKFCLPNSLIL
jgi:hypothetical protein